MNFSPSFLDEIRARIPVSEVVRRRVPLKKAGREWKGLSPFNPEKTPSFTVNDQKGFYHCFSSGKHGDVFRFLMETEGVSFPEAVERLASIAGLSIPSSSPEQEKREAKRKNLFEVMELATKFFESALQSHGGADARGYLADRGIVADTIREFRIGYAPGDRYALKEYLGKNGVPVGDMVETGLLISGDDIPVSYDRFRDRVIFPIQDQRGRVVAFGGRTMKSDVQPKYLNSPETSLFHKGSTVFNFHRARPAAHAEEAAIVVEGYLDAISVYQAGIKYVVATMGTAFTEEQIETLWKLAPEPVICFDNDSAGRKAADRSIDRILPLLRVGVSFRFAFLPEGKDPDDLIRHGGLAEFAKVLKNPESLWDRMWVRESDRKTVETPDDKASFEKAMFDLIALIGDSRVRQSYKFRARAQLVAFFKALDWGASTHQKKKSFVSRELSVGLGGPLVGIEKILLGTMIHYHDSLLELHIERLVLTELTGELEAFKRDIYRIYREFEDHSPLSFYRQISESYLKIFEDIYGPLVDSPASTPHVKPENIYRRFPLLSLDPPVTFVDRCVNLFFLMLETRELSREIKKIELDPAKANDPREVEIMLNWVRDLHEQRGLIQALDRELADGAKHIRKNYGEPPSPWLSPGIEKAVELSGA